MRSPNQSDHFSEKKTQMTNICKQAGTGPSHIQGSKIAKRLPSVNLQYSKFEKPENGPGALKGGHFRNCQNFCRI